MHSGLAKAQVVLLSFIDVGSNVLPKQLSHLTWSCRHANLCPAYNQTVFCKQSNCVLHTIKCTPVLQLVNSHMQSVVEQRCFLKQQSPAALPDLASFLCPSQDSVLHTQLQPPPRYAPRLRLTSTPLTTNTTNTNISSSSSIRGMRSSSRWTCLQVRVLAVWRVPPTSVLT